MTIHNDKIDAAVACVQSHLDSPLPRAEALESAGLQLRRAEHLDDSQRHAAVGRLVSSGTISEEERGRYF
jgi:hypothetical protein